MPVDLHAIMFEYDSTQNIELMNADILVVPPVNTLVYVQGEVVSPSALLFTPNQHASDYIGQAGGPTHYGDMRRGYIQRGRQRISLRDDPIVEPSDKVVVPRVGIRWWQDYLQIVSAIGIPVASIVISIYALSNN
jgi:hypothetical protein